jgi:NAD(P)H-quinone oxidoreductase subunit 6
MLDSAIFWAFAILSIGAALGAVFTRSIINSALCLIAVFMSIAGFFVLNNADFLAIAQIIIYAVGLTIIMLFAIMFTGDKVMERQKVNRMGRLAYGIIIAYVFALLIRGVLSDPTTIMPQISPEVAMQLSAQGSTTMLGELLFNKYGLPFELASLLLLAAMIGAIVIAKKRFAESDEDQLGEMRLALDLASAPREDAVAALRRDRMTEQERRQADIIGLPAAIVPASDDQEPGKETVASPH